MPALWPHTPWLSTLRLRTHLCTHLLRRLHYVFRLMVTCNYQANNLNNLIVTQPAHRDLLTPISLITCLNLCSYIKLILWMLFQEAAAEDQCVYKPSVPRRHHFLGLRGIGQRIFPIGYSDSQIKDHLILVCMITFFLWRQEFSALSSFLSKVRQSFFFPNDFPFSLYLSHADKSTPAYTGICCNIVHQFISRQSLTSIISGLPRCHFRCSWVLCIVWLSQTYFSFFIVIRTSFI